MPKTLNVMAALLAAGLLQTATAATVNVEPDSFAPGTNISAATAGLTLSAVGPGYGHSGTGIYATVIAGNTQASTGRMVFGTNGGSFPDLFQAPNLIAMRGDFSTAVYGISLDFISDLGDPSDIGLLQLFDSSNNLLASLTTNSLGFGAFETLSFVSGTSIAYFLASGDSGGSAMSLDNLSFNTGNRVPLPGSLALAGLGLLGAATLKRRSKA